MRGCARSSSSRALVWSGSGSPASGVRALGDRRSAERPRRRAYAFLGCLELSVLRFEDGSRIQSLGHGAFFNTKLRRRGVRYPPGLKTNGSEYKP